MNIRNTQIYNFARCTYHFMKKGRPKGYIFMLHRVDDKDPARLSCNENMKISPLFLEKFILNYKAKYDFIPISDVPSRLKSDIKKRFMAFALDDGYKDNFTQAMPVFAKHDVPFTVFLTTDFPDKKAVLWWYTLEDYLLTHDKIRMADGRQINIETKAEKEIAFLDIRKSILELDQTNLLQELPKLFIDEIPWRNFNDDLVMNWEEVKLMSRNKLATIGCHTKHHYNLRKLKNVDEVVDEIMEGRKRLFDKVHIDSDIFAYPFGSPNEVGEREVDALSKLPFKLACIAYGGWLGNKDKIDMYALPRLMLTEDFNERQLE